MNRDDFNKILSEKDVFDVIDLQTDIRVGNCTFEDLQIFAYDIMEARSQSLNDDLANRYKELIKNGHNDISKDQIFVLLHDYEYSME